MLAEIYSLKQSLDAGGLGIPLTHRDFQTPPGLTSYKTLIAAINKTGHIVRLRSPLEGEIPGLWTLKKGNFKFFPAVRLTEPLFELPVEDSRRESLHAVCAAKTAKVAEWEVLAKSLQFDRKTLRNPQDFRALAKDQASRFKKWEAGDAKHLFKLREFADAFDSFSRFPGMTRRKFLRAILAQIQADDSKDFLGICTHFLVGQKKEKKGQAPTIEFKVQIIFDYTDSSTTSNTLHQREVHETVLLGLNSESEGRKNDPLDESGEGLVTCAFGSGNARLLSEPFGGFSIQPIINKEQAPYSKKGRSQGVPCNDRYHRADSDGFPIGEEFSRSLVGAMKAITSPEMQDKNWRSIKNGKMEDKHGKKKEAYDILVAFPDFEAGDTAPVAPFGKRFSSGNEDSTDEEIEVQQRTQLRRKSAFQQASEPVCQAFEEKLPRFPNGRLTMLLLRQISPGQIQLAYGNKLTIVHFIAAIRRWQETEGNLPPTLKIPVTFKGTDGFRLLSPGLLFPEEICSLLTHQWVRNGTHSARLNAPTVGTILDIFLHRFDGHEETAALDQIIALILQRSDALLVHGGGSLRKDTNGTLGPWQKFSAPSGSGNDPRWALLRTISLIGMLLSLRKSKFQNYMNEHAYLTGYLLACADELHKHYHLGNSGKLPSTLIGNGLLSKAAETPAAAIAELLDRARIYIGWAKTTPQLPGDDSLKEDKSAGAREKKAKLYAPSNARNALEEMEETAAKLAAEWKQAFPENAEPKELDVTQKAKMFLGYLTPIPRRLKPGQDDGNKAPVNENK